MTSLASRVITRIVSNARLALYDKPLMALYFRRLFSGKSVAIVGSAPELLNQNLGGIIDMHDVIVRINLMHLNGTDDRQGSRTDVRFIGCTLLERHEPYLRKIATNDVVITTKKNVNAPGLQGKNVFFHPSRLPFQSFRTIAALTNRAMDYLEIRKPPRSGLFFVTLLLKYGSPRKISIFGFSTKEEEATKYLSYTNGNVDSYDLHKLANNHCSITDELRAINDLANSNLVSVH